MRIILESISGPPIYGNSQLGTSALSVGCPKDQKDLRFWFQGPNERGIPAISVYRTLVFIYHLQYTVYLLPYTPYAVLYTK